MNNKQRTVVFRLAVTLNEDDDVMLDPSDWLFGALEHLFDTYNDDGTLVNWSFEELPRPARKE